MGRGGVEVSVIAYRPNATGLSPSDAKLELSRIQN